MLEKKDRAELLRHALALAPNDATATALLVNIKKGRLDPREVAQLIVNNAAARVH